MTAVIVLISVAIVAAVLEIVWLNGYWIAPGGWRSWLKCRLRRDSDHG